MSIKNDYKIIHKFLDLNVEYNSRSSGEFLIIEEGEYKIECILTILVNGQEIKSTDYFEFKVIKSDSGR